MTNGDWARDLDHASNKLEEAARNLSRSFIDKDLPDPISLVHRIRCLEDDMKRLASDCAEIDEKKRGFVLSLLQLQVENAKLLREVSESTGGPPADGIDLNQWEALASSAEHQRALLSRHHPSGEEAAAAV